jgi:2-polyprenyl-3-methyl-5-hydroxy-6-metoxy-1,4-benzoquinol methylase
MFKHEALPRPGRALVLRIQHRCFSYLNFNGKVNHPRQLEPLPQEMMRRILGWDELRCGVSRHMPQVSQANPFLEFYGSHNISPVHQDISDLKVHLARREKLFRQLGVFPGAFQGKRILEIGPGGGYNSIAFFAWGADLDFVEPNPRAQEEIPVLLSQYGIENQRWRLFREKVEDIVFDRKYDIVVAEGFLPNIADKESVIAVLSAAVSSGGVVSVTCVDEISVFFEIVKRQIAYLLSRNEPTFAGKVSLLAKAFSSHLASLGWASRPIEDWVTDNFLNPWISIPLFSIEDCIKSFGPDFELHGASPSMFSDYSWYKDLSDDSNQSFLSQFEGKRHLLMMTNMKESVRPESANRALLAKVTEFKDLCGRNEARFDSNLSVRIVEKLVEIKGVASDLDERIGRAIDDALSLLRDANLTHEKVSNAAHLRDAFGKGQQYVSMRKKFTAL